MCIALGTVQQVCIVEPERNDGPKSKVEANNVHCKKIEDLRTQAKIHMKLEHRDAEWKPLDWTQEIRIDPKPDSFRDHLIGMMADLESMWNGNLGPINVARDRIELALHETGPVQCAPYRSGLRACELEKIGPIRCLKLELLTQPRRNGQFSWCLFQKKDGSVRWSVEYRKLQAVSVHDSYPSRRIVECIELLGIAPVLFTLDANCNYWPAKSDQGNRDKPAFTSYHGLFRFSGMTFGLSNCPGTFQQNNECNIIGDEMTICRILPPRYYHISVKCWRKSVGCSTVLSLLHKADVIINLKQYQFFYWKDGLSWVCYMN